MSPNTLVNALLYLSQNNSLQVGSVGPLKHQLSGLL